MYPRCYGLAVPAEVGEQCRMVQGDRSFRDEGGDGLGDLSVALRRWERV